MEKGFKQEFIEKLHERLAFITSQTSENDAKEAKTIKNVLNIIEAEKFDETYYNAEKSLERFNKTLEIRMRIHEEMFRFSAREVTLADYSNDAPENK